MICTFKRSLAALWRNNFRWERVKTRDEFGNCWSSPNEMVVTWSDPVEKVLWLDLGYILKVKLTGLTNGFDRMLEEVSKKHVRLC